MNPSRAEFWNMVYEPDHRKRAALAYHWEDDWIEECHYMAHSSAEFAAMAPGEWQKIHEFRKVAAPRALGQEVAAKCAVSWQRFSFAGADLTDGFTLTVILPKRKGT